MKILLLAFGGVSQPYGIIDVYNYLLSKKYAATYLHIYNDYKKLNTVDFTPDYVGITLYTQLSDVAVNLIALVRAKWPKAKIILGGRHISDDALEVEKDRLLKQSDHVVIGEGEYAFEKIINGGMDKIVRGERITKADFDKLPFPDKFTMANQCGGFPTGCLFARGCAYDCVFCCENRKPLLVREPDVAVRHIKNLIEWSGNREIYVWDDIFSSNKKWLCDFRDELKRQKVNPKIRCFIHGRNFNEEMLDLLIECHVKYMSLGAESGDDGILKLIRKHTTVDDYLRINELFRKRKEATLHTLWMFCNIGETVETMKKTLELSKKIITNRPHYSFAAPFPGTSFWKLASQYGKTIEPHFGKWVGERLVFLPKGVKVKQAQAIYKSAMRIQKKIKGKRDGH